MDLGVSQGAFSLNTIGINTGINTGINMGINNGVYNENLLPNNIVKNGLVLYLDAAYPKSYPTSGILWKDLSINKLNATLINGPVYNSSNNGSIILDGTNDNITVTPPVLSESQKEGFLTYEYWVKPNGTVTTGYTENFGTNQFFSPGSNQGLGGDISYKYSGGGFVGFQFMLGTNGFLAGWQQVGYAPFVLVDYKTITGINHLVVIKNTQTIDYYLNGIFQKTSLNLNASKPGWVIGDTMSIITSTQPTYTGRYFNGTIYSVRFYSRALTQSEINQNYQATKSRFNL